MKRPPSRSADLGGPRLLRIGEWQLDCSTYRLSRGDQERTLSPKQMAVLRYLANHAPELVTLENLLAHCWPGRVVGDNVVHQIVRQLRIALGDDAHQPRYIETLSKRGYRLLAPIAPPASIDPTAISENGAQAFSSDVVHDRSTARETSDLTARRRVRIDAPDSKPTDHETVAHADRVRAELIDRLATAKTLDIVTEGAWDNVHYVVDIDVLRTAGKLQTYVRVLRSATTEIVWSERFTQTDDMNTFVHGVPLSRLIEVVVLHDWFASWFAGTLHPQGLREYVYGSIEWVRWTLGIGGHTRIVLQHWHRALQIDPKNWPAQRQLTIHYSNRYDWHGSLPSLLYEARAAASALIELERHNDDYPAQAQVEWAFPVAMVLYRLEFDFDAAERCLAVAKAKGFAPADIDAELAIISGARGHLARGLEYGESAISAGPQVNEIQVRWTLGLLRIAAGSYATAAEGLMEALRITTDGSRMQVVIRHALITALHFAGRTEEADQVLESSWRLFRETAPNWFIEAMVLRGRTDEARALLARAEAECDPDDATTYHHPVCQAYCHLGDLDRAFMWLDRAIDNREVYFLAQLRRAPHLAALREDPRGAVAMAKLAAIESTPSPLRRAIARTGLDLSKGSRPH